MAFEDRDRMDFKAIVYNFYYRLSELSFLSRQIDFHVDTHWAVFYPYIDEDGEAMWESFLFTASNPYEATMNKVKAITLLLYKNGVITQRDIKNRQYEKYLKRRHKRDHIASEIMFENVVIRHMTLLGMLTKKGMGIMMHVDLMWAFLAPYVTEEDYLGMENIAGFQRENPKDLQVEYQALIDKIRIISTVADRAQFELLRGTMDISEDEEHRW